MMGFWMITQSNYTAVLLLIACIVTSWGESMEPIWKTIIYFRGAQALV